MSKQRRPGDILYDVYNCEVIQLEFVKVINAEYACCINIDTSKPISVWLPRLNNMHSTKADALKELQEELLTKLDATRQELTKISTYVNK